jgi:ribonucleoside-triphosphate reductase
MSSNYFATPYQEFIHLSRYSRWLPEKNRRETWSETVGRYFDFFEEHLRDNNNFTLTKDVRKELEEAVLNQWVMPSMRCLMTAGEALNRENVAGYNCSYVAVDNPRSFDEILYILMNGTGVGFSVEQKFTDQLPIVADEFHESDTTIVVADSKLGWAKALKELIQLLYSGQVPKWDVSKVRPAGTPLKTFGGRASGPEPLVSLFKFCVTTFKKAMGRRLTTLECHDIVCKIAEIVVVGGVRRSALISLSDLSDDRMRVAKSGEWWKDNVQRALANNSFVAREKIDVGIFMKEWLSLYESKSGERGIFSRTASQNQAERFGRRDPNHEFGTNPCSEIILRSREFCNLTEVVVRESDTVITLAKKVKLATILGTIQSTLTNFKYISKKWKENCEEERLLGVSLTGILDNPLLNLSNGEHFKFELEKTLHDLRDVAVETNKEWSGKIGIPQSAAVTCVKPSGCTTLETEIMTEHGKMSMADIFAEYSDENIFECNPGTWLNLNKPLKVMDENYELQNVTKLYINGINEVYEIEDTTGNVYKFTGNHKLKTTNGWKRVDELTENDEIIQFGNS